MQSDAALIASVTGVNIISSFFNGAVTVLLPTIQKDLNLSPKDLVWPISLYTLIIACFLPL